MAPEFDGNDLLSNKVNLNDYRGKWLLLSFYRYASCPLCNLRVHDLSVRQAEWQSHGLEMLAVFQSPAEKLLQSVGKQGAPITIIPDPEQRLYSLYSVSHSWFGFLKAWIARLPEVWRSVFLKQFLPGTVEGGIHRIPADFLINPQGRIVVAYYGKDIGDHLPVRQIEDQFKTAEQHKILLK